MKAMSRVLWFAHMLYESLFSNVRQRTDQIDVFTTEMSCLTIVWATIEGITLRKVPVE
jgi:transposase-like protein